MDLPLGFPTSQRTLFESLRATRTQKLNLGHAIPFNSPSFRECRLRKALERARRRWVLQLEASRRCAIARGCSAETRVGTVLVDGEKHPLQVGAQNGSGNENVENGGRWIVRTLVGRNW